MSDWHSGEIPPYPAKLYRALHTGNPGDIAFYRSYCEAAQSVIEFGCGDARVLVELRGETLERIVGLELHAGLLEYAHRAVARREKGLPPIQLVEADMTNPPALGQFDCVIVPHSGLYCLMGESALAQTLAAAHRLLTPGGILLFDVWAADDFHEAHIPSEQEDSWVDHLGRFEIEGESWEIIETSSWFPKAQRVDVSYTHVQVGHEQAVNTLLPQRYFLHAQILDALAQAGFTQVSTWGGFEREAFVSDSELLVVEARA